MEEKQIELCKSSVCGQINENYRLLIELYDEKRRI